MKSQQNGAGATPTTENPDRSDRLARLPLRDELRGQEPYGAPQLTVRAMLNVNETTYDVPADVVDAITTEVRHAAQSLNRYPDREFTRLREKLADYLGHGLSAENIWAANGSNEIMQHILQAFAGPGRSVLAFPPTYSMYPLYARGPTASTSRALGGRTSRRALRTSPGRSASTALMW